MEPEEKNPQQQWLEKWKARLGELLQQGKDDFVEALNAHAKAGSTHPALNPMSTTPKDLSCQALDGTPMPYVLNAGCGFWPTSAGFRTYEGRRPVTVVGVDPLAHAINEAHGVLSLAHADVAKSRRFIVPIAAEELGAVFPPGTFHAAWSDGAFLDCFDPVRFLQALVRSTKQGGVVCVKFDSMKEGQLWKVLGHDGGRIVLSSDRGQVEITEIRGERVELHTMLDGDLMIKIRRAEHSQEEAEKRLMKATGGLIVPAR